MSLRHLSWRERGKLAFEEGIPLDEPPFPPGVPEYDEWRVGHTDAALEADKDKDETPEDDGVSERIDVQVVFADGRLRLTDLLGRVLGGQVNMIVEQRGGDDVCNATVTFVELKLVTVGFTPVKPKAAT